jgi:hypothetical protein
MEETTEEYITRIRKMLPDSSMTVPDTEYYQKLKIKRPDLNLTIKGQSNRETNSLIAAACYIAAGKLDEKVYEISDGWVQKYIIEKLTKYLGFCKNLDIY